MLEALVYALKGEAVNSMMIVALAMIVLVVTLVYVAVRGIETVGSAKARALARSFLAIGAVISGLNLWQGKVAEAVVVFALSVVIFGLPPLIVPLPKLVSCPLDLPPSLIHLECEFSIGPT